MESGYEVGYDEVPYDSLPATSSHPNRLSALAALMGLAPPPVERCRILELGCGIGANALPIAADLPDAEVIGIDLSGRQIEVATAAARELGLANASFRQLDILEVGPDLGRFDYVIAHGIYSWVPPAVRDRVLAIAGLQLTDAGLAYVSYNTYPGWHLTDALRGYLRFHVRAAPDATARVAGVAEAFSLLAAGVTDRSDRAARVLRDYAANYAATLDGIGGNRRAALHHDILATINQPVYLTDLVAHARSHGLAYVAEADLWCGLAPGTSAEAHHTIAGWTADPIERQQYLDFLSMRGLRQSVLCRAAAAPATAPQPTALRGLHVASQLRPASARPELDNDRVERFTSPAGMTLSSKQPVTKAGLCHLADVAPRSVAFDELVAAACARLGWAAPTAELSPDALDLARVLVLAAVNEPDLITVQRVAPRLAHQVGPRPRGRELARWQLKFGPIVTNHHHAPVSLTRLQVAVLERLDGTRDRAALLDELVGLAGAGQLAVTQKGKPVPPAQLRSVLGRDLDLALAGLAEMALLTAG